MLEGGGVNRSGSRIALQLLTFAGGGGGGVVNRSRSHIAVELLTFAGGVQQIRISHYCLYVWP